MNGFRIDFMNQVQLTLGEEIANAHWSSLAARRLGEYQHLLTAGIPQLGVLVYLLLQMFAEALLVLIYLALSCLVSWPVTFVVAALSFFPLLRHARGRAFLTGKQLFNGKRNFYSVMESFLGGIKQAKAANLTCYYTERFASLGNDLGEQEKRFLTFEAKTRFRFSVLSVTALVVVFFLSVEVIRVELAAVLALTVLFFRIAPRMSSLQQGYMKVSSLLPIYSQMEIASNELRRQREDIAPSPPPILARAIRFLDVSFSYGTTHILKDANFSIPFGMTTLIAGPSGIGKSTVLDLILGLQIPSSGEIWVDSERLSPQLLHGWRSVLGYVPRDPYLFNGTVRGNLEWGDGPYPDHRLWQALELAAADALVRRMPNGLQTELIGGGECLSAGERQRLALARVLVRNPKVLLLDEATVSIDEPVESNILSAIRKIHPNMTIVLVSHRAGAARLAHHTVHSEDFVRPLPSYRSPKQNEKNACNAPTQHCPN